METKFVLKSVTFWGAILSGLLAVVDHLTGVQLNDQVGSLEAAITEVVQAALAAMPAFALPVAHLVAVVTVIVGRFRATQPLSIAPKSAAPSFPGAVSMFACTAVLASLLGLTGCATGTSSGSSSASSLLTTVTPYLAQAAGAGSVTAAVELAGGKKGGPTKAQLASDFLSIASAGYTITTSQAVSNAQIQAIFTSFKSNASTTAYDTEATAVANELELFLAAHPGAAQADLTNFFQGVQIAAGALGGTVTTTSALWHPAAVIAQD